VKKSLVLGIGNVLLSDDGAGVHAARRIAERLAARERPAACGGRAACDDVQVLDGGTLSFTLAPLIAGTQRLIILDATQLGRPPGTVQSFVGGDVDRLLGRTHLTVHEIGLRDVFELLKLDGGLPSERALIGIQPASLTWGTEPTAAVAAALEDVVGLALRLLDQWPGSSASSQPDSQAA
jgi:hydrogenase maturation protease